MLSCFFIKSVFNIILKHFVAFVIQDKYICSCHLWLVIHSSASVTPMDGHSFAPPALSFVPHCNLYLINGWLLGINHFEKASHISIRLKIWYSRVSYLWFALVVPFIYFISSDLWLFKHQSKIPVIYLYLLRLHTDNLISIFRIMSFIKDLVIQFGYFSWQ